MTFRTYALLFITSLSMAMQATPVTQNTARLKAQAFLASLGKQVNTGSPILHASPNTTAPWYFFNAEDDGFVIIAGDDAFGDLLGYSEHGTFNPGTVPPNMAAWLDDVALQMEVISKSGVAPAPYHGPRHSSISPLVSTQWSQGVKDSVGSAYNLCAPVIDGRYCLAGCLAVAMGQVMRYHQWPEEACEPIPGYKNTGTDITLEDLPQMDFNWDDMLPQYGGKESEEQRMAVARLLRYCGQAAKTIYRTDKSEAYAEDAATALTTIFGYAPTIRHIKRDNCSEAEWEQAIYKELASSRPVIYFGMSESGSHSFICDGYDDNGLYHINWGWGGLYDGFFNLSILVPEEGDEEHTGKDYSYHQHALTGIMTNSFSGQVVKFSDQTVKDICLSQWDFNGDGELSLSEAEKVRSLDDAFRETDITTFDELQYFTGLETITPTDFEGCTNLTSVTIPENVSRIFRGAFSNCPLSHLAVSPNNTFYDSRDNCNAIIETGSATLVKGCATTIIPETVEIIGEAAFEGCTELEAVTLPEGLTTIGTRSFMGCTGLESLTIPSTVTSIHQQAFAYCGNISTIFIDQPIPPLTAPDAFEGCNPIVHVPAGAKDAYTKAEGWCNLLIEESQYDNYLYCNDIELRRPLGGKLEIGLHNTDTVIGCQGQIILPEGVSIATDKRDRLVMEASERMTDHQLHCSRQADGSYVFMSMDLSPITDNDGILFSFPLEIADSVEAGVYEVSFDQLTISTIDENEKIDGIYPLPFTTRLSLKDYLLGDVDHDRHINVNDVMTIVNYILGKPLATFYKDEADIDINDHIDVVDVMRLVQMVIHQVNDSYAPRREGAVLLDASACNLTLHLDDATRYTAMQARIRTTAGHNISSIRLNAACADSHQLSWGEAPDGSITMVVYSLDGQPFGHDITALVDMESDGPTSAITVDNILLSTIDLRTVGAGALTCIDGVKGTEAPSQPTYTLSGQRAGKDYKGVVVSKGRKRVGTR